MAFHLENVSVDIADGAMVAVVGPNGAGKTSLLRCLLGLNEHYSGTIQIGGQELKQHSRKTMALKLAYVPQQTESLFDLSVFDVVQMGLLPHMGLFQVNGEFEHERINHALAKVGMAHAELQKINTLSGGELQRVLIARALVQEAEVLILDEPTNHLDVYFQHQILALLKQLRISVILTIHDLNLAAQYCDQVLLLHKGQCKGVGTPVDVFQSELLTEVFGLPCTVVETQTNISSSSERKTVPSISFHPTGSMGGDIQ